MSSVLWYSAWHIVGAQKVFVVTSLVVQWLGVCLPLWRSGEIPHVAAQLLKALCTREPVLCNTLRSLSITARG